MFDATTNFRLTGADLALLVVLVFAAGCVAVLAARAVVAKIERAFRNQRFQAHGDRSDLANSATVEADIRRYRDAGLLGENLRGFGARGPYKNPHAGAITGAAATALTERRSVQRPDPQFAHVGPKTGQRGRLVLSESGWPSAADVGHLSLDEPAT